MYRYVERPLIAIHLFCSRTHFSFL